MNDKIIENINNILQTDSLKNVYNNYFKDKLCGKVVKISIVDIALKLSSMFLLKSSATSFIAAFVPSPEI